MSLKVVKPIEVTPGMLTSSVPVDDYPAWNAGATYAAEQRVVHEFQVWQSNQDANTGKQPATNGTWWVAVGPVNRMKAFDRSHTTKTRFSHSAWFEIQLEGTVNALALMECEGLRSVRIQVDHPSYGLLYEQTVGMWSISQKSSWYDWVYGERREQDSLYRFDLPSYRGAYVRIEIEAANDAAIGVILLGQQQDIGFGVSPGLSMGIRDYSRKETDQWGEVTLQKRAYARERSFKVNCLKTELDNTDRLLTSLRAAPALWLLSNQYQQANVYGWASDYKLLVDYGPYCVLSLQLEGLI